MDTAQIERLQQLTSILVNLTLFAASVIAIIKLKLFKLLEYRFRSEFRATHIELSDGKILFEGDYVVHNTGDRPIKLTKVDLGLYGFRKLDDQVVIDKDQMIFRRIIAEDNKDLEGLLNIQSGERSIFTIRCVLPHLEEMLFVYCRLEWPYKRKPASYLSLYVKDRSVV